MKYLIACLLFLVFSHEIYTQDVPLTTKITEVTLYKLGALVEREGSCRLQSGLNTLKIAGLPSDLMEGSIVVKAPEGVSIISLDAAVRLNKPDAEDVATQVINDKIIGLTDSLSLLEKKINALQVEKQSLQVDGYVSNQNFTVANFKELIEYKRERTFKIDEDIILMEKQGRRMKSSVTKLENEIRRNNAAATSEYYEAEVVIDSRVSGDQKFVIQYYIEDAGWTPKYDVVVDAINKPIELVYKAEVHQDSYEDWEDVNLVVSTGQPQFGYTAPSLGIYYLYFDNYDYRPSSSTAKVFKGSKLSGRVYDSTGEPLIGANVMIKGSNNVTITDLGGSFEIDVPRGGNTVVVAYVGYDTKEVPIYASYLDIRLQEGAILDEVVVTGYSGGRGRKAGAVEEYSMEDASTYDPATTLHGRTEGIQISAGIERYNPTVEYQLSEKVTIAGQEKPKTIRLNSTTLETDLFYRTIPKVEEAAYLFARVSNWEELNLQEGSYSVLFEGKYLTNYALNLDGVEEKLELSLGIDEDIRVKREPIKDFTKRTFLSKNVKEKKSWNITVINGKSVTVPIEIQDQYPISNNGDIDIDIQELSGAAEDKEKGLITWTLSLTAKQKVEKVLTYEVKYPNDRNLIVD